MLTVGLTGGIGSGKSTVARVLGEFGAPILDADKVAHTTYAPGGPAYDAVVAAFGADIVHQFEEGPVIADVPEQMRKENQKCGDAAEPKPFVEQEAALFGEEQAHDDSEAE